MLDKNALTKVNYFSSHGTIFPADNSGKIRLIYAYTILLLN